MNAKTDSHPVHETLTIHGLRDRKSGEMLRVESRREMRYGELETVYHLSTDSDSPVFDAGSPRALLEVFARGGGGSEYSPYLGQYTPELVEPVLMTEVISRSFEPLTDSFEIPVSLKIAYATDIPSPIANRIEGMAEIVDVVDGFSKEFMDTADAHWKGKPHRLVALLLHQHPDELAHVPPGARLSNGLHGFSDRRALAVLPVTDEQMRMLAGERHKVEAMSWVVCLSDTRPIPAELQGILEERAAKGGAPAP